MQFDPTQIFLVIKIGFLIILFLFTLFLAVILKQIRMMNISVTQPNLFPILQTFVFVLLGLSISLFLISLVIL